MSTTLRLNSMADFEALKSRDTRRTVPREVAVEYGWLRDTAAAELKKKLNPRGRHEDGKMNKSEQFYSTALDLRKKAGEIKNWKFEAIKLKLADRCTYTPDFNVEMANGDLVMVEVKKVWKGHNAPHFEDDAVVKIKVAAELFPWFIFYASWWDGSQWSYRLYPCSTRERRCAL
jgi:hypothetical protein